MQSRQPACGVGVPEGRFQAERLQWPTDPQSPQPSSDHQSALTISQAQSPSCLMSGLYSTESAECCPSTTSNQWACLPRKYLVSSGRSKIILDLGQQVYAESPASVARSALGRQTVLWTRGTSVLNIQRSQPRLNTAST
jgi:hypothetical protein